MAYRGTIERPESTGERFLREFSRTGQIGNSLGQQFRGDYQKKAADQELVNALVGQGLSPEEAKLYSMLNTGSQTNFTKDLLDLRRRGGMGGPGHGGQDQLEEEPNPDQELESYLSEKDLGLTPAEKVRRESERFKTGLPVYQKAGETLRSLTKTKHRLDLLDDLVKSNKLPTGLGRLNVDAEGNLKLPFLASPEAQRAVKTINEFAAGAKDTYGSRVTNFDLAQYLKQFPSLLNSKEGMKQLTSQLKIVNDINSVYYKNLKDVYDTAGGTRKIDADIAESIAERKSEKQVEKLAKRFQDIGTEESLPPAHKNKGERFRDDETGETFVSNGKEWVKEG